jgi:hypothetical protein
VLKVLPIVWFPVTMSQIGSTAEPKKSSGPGWPVLLTGLVNTHDFFVAIQLTSDLPDSGVKSAHIH